MQPVPATEILSRQFQLQELLAAAGIELALIRQTADLYYYSGTIVDGFLALGSSGRTAAAGPAAPASVAGTRASLSGGLL